MGAMNKQAMYKLSYGLFVLTAAEGEKHNEVTSEPNQIAFAVNKMNLTHDMLVESKVFNISILSEDASFDIFKRFGFQSGREVDKFADYGTFDAATGVGDKYAISENGITYIKEGTNSYISGEVEQTVDLGTHTLGTIEKGETSEGTTVWRCVICGYEWVGEELPDDFICPICKHPKSDFEKIVK